MFLAKVYVNIRFQLYLVNESRGSMYVIYSVSVCLQSISEEEQQRVLGEQKMIGFKKGSGGSKKKSRAKVSPTMRQYHSPHQLHIFHN